MLYDIQNYIKQCVLLGVSEVWTRTESNKKYPSW